MKYKKETKEFIKFLKKEGVYHKFIENLSTFNTINDLLIEQISIDYLVGAFTWYNTKEGSSFWNELNDKWEKKVESITRKNKKLLKKFLKKEGVYHKFVKNLKNLGSVSLNELPRKYKLHKLISSSFVWRATPEGHTFWNEINKKWKKKISDGNY